jgi:hypothetical protein
MTCKQIAILLIIFSIIIVLVTGCGSSKDNSMSSILPPTPTTYQSTVNQLLTLVHKYPLPDHLRHDGVKTPDDFDVNEYFSVLKHISMKPGYVLDYAYYNSGTEGEPVLYVRKADQPTYQNYSEYSAAVIAGEVEQGKYSYIKGVNVDNTEMVFFELVVLRTMGTHFYQFWHANYNDAVVICDQTGLEALRLIQGGVPYDVQKKARELDFNPVVKIIDNTVMVQIVIFTNWGGFMQETYVVSRNFPHNILNYESKVLVDYNCHITF